MCTVTFLPTQKGVCLTSNRDEKNTRLTALPPLIYSDKETALLYPKDANRGGTWIAANENGNAAVLLNGGFISHLSTPPYRQSRGTIIPLVLSDDNPVSFLNNYNCNGIEPFTLILFSNHRLYECRWTGVIKHTKKLDPAKTHIWSSVTLYNETTIRKRRAWFEQWQHRHENPKQADIIRFHRFAGDGNTTNDLLMNRNNQVFTVSITSLLIGEEETKMIYTDTVNETTYTSSLPFSYSLTSESLY